MLGLPPVRRSDREDRRAELEMLAGLGLDQHRDDRLSEISYGTRKVLDVTRPRGCQGRLRRPGAKAPTDR